MKIKEKIGALIGLMEQRNIDVYIVPSGDPHQSEYVSPHWQSRKWITGFSGSAGTAVITREKGCGLWVDARYYIQADAQTAGTGIMVQKMGLDGVPDVIQWIGDNFPGSCTIGFDGRTVSQSFFNSIKTAFGDRAGYVFDQDLIGELWKERDELRFEEVKPYSNRYAGEDRKDKLARVRKYMADAGLTHYIISSLDDVAWLFNIRGSDIPNNPVVTAYAAITLTEARLYAERSSMSAETQKALEADGVVIRPYLEITEYVSSIPDGSTVTYDPAKTSASLAAAVGQRVKAVEKRNCTTDFKAVKNSVEAENMRSCQLEDGIAMVKFIHWLKTNYSSTQITELSAAEKLREFRAQGPNFRGLSFETISAYGTHAAIMHYSVDTESSCELCGGGLYLVDSGGQYITGTTDITRTIALGKVTPEEKHGYTLVLKSFISFARTKFPYGCTGGNIDFAARRFLWNECLNYKTATGHGVGCYLNVHEGPQRTMYNFDYPGVNESTSVVLEAGMDITNEPGLYIEGHYGVRIENMLLIHKDQKTAEEQFMSFENLTMCPIDTDALNPDELDGDEKAWLNAYHRKVCEKLSPRLEGDLKKWLETETRPV
jgi:Xaa-Pro aminopeptidase